MWWKSDDLGAYIYVSASFTTWPQPAMCLDFTIVNVNKAVIARMSCFALFVYNKILSNNNNIIIMLISINLYT